MSNVLQLFWYCLICPFKFSTNDTRYIEQNMKNQRRFTLTNKMLAKEITFISQNFLSVIFFRYHDMILLVWKKFNMRQFITYLIIFLILSIREKYWDYTQSISCYLDNLQHISIWFYLIKKYNFLYNIFKCPFYKYKHWSYPTNKCSIIIC